MYATLIFSFVRSIWEKLQWHNHLMTEYSLGSAKRRCRSIPWMLHKSSHTGPWCAQVAEPQSSRVSPSCSSVLHDIVSICAAFINHSETGYFQQKFSLTCQARNYFVITREAQGVLKFARDLVRSDASLFSFLAYVQFSFWLNKTSPTRIFSGTFTPQPIPRIPLERLWSKLQ